MPYMTAIYDKKNNETNIKKQKLRPKKKMKKEKRRKNRGKLHGLVIGMQRKKTTLK